MIGVVFLLLLAIPVAELWVIVQVAEQIGILSTLGALVAISAAGAWLLKREGIAAWNRVRMAAVRGEVPTAEIADGALVILGGVLLLTPGFLTDAVGLVLLFPPTRAALRGASRRGLGSWAARRGGRAGAAARAVYDARVVGVTRNEDRAGDRRRLPSTEERSSEDGSPDRG